MAVIKQIVVTKSRYWFERYCNERNLNRMETIWAYDEYSTQGHPRETLLILTNGFTRLGAFQLGLMRERFSRIVTDQL